MTKLSITLAIASLTLSLAPAANAYEQGPEAAPELVSLATQVNVLFKAAEQAQDGQCSVHIEPVMATLLGLDKPEQSFAGTPLSLACYAE